MKTKFLNGKLIFGFLLAFLIFTGSVSATHTATVTVEPSYVRGGGLVIRIRLRLRIMLVLLISFITLKLLPLLVSP